MKRYHIRIGASYAQAVILENPKYSISSPSGPRRTSADLIAGLCEIDTPEAALSMSAIVGLEVKGMWYSNQDFDVLSHASSLILKHRSRARAPSVVTHRHTLE